MLEILVLMQITRRMNVIAERKGEKPIKWRLYVIAGWLLPEFLGAFITMKLTQNILMAYVVGIVGMIATIALVWYNLNSLPDKEQWTMDQIGEEVK